MRNFPSNKILNIFIKFSSILFGLFLAFGIWSFVSADNNEIEINFFYSRTCPHCVKESKFLDEIEAEYSGLKINRFEASENMDLLMKFYNDYDISSEKRGLVPIIFIEEEYFLGFNNEIKNEIKTCILGKIEDNSYQECQCQECSSGESTEINIPIIGKIDISRYSLSVLAVVLGTLDGFNVCSLGALILILGLVLALRSRKKILFFGGLFILTTAFVYGVLIVLWYQAFFFLTPYLKIMEILIGLLAIGGGIYFLRQFIKFKKYGPTCEINTGGRIISKFSSKFKQSFEESKNILLLTGLILIFAIIITIVEFPCSAAVPLVFAGVLANSQLPTFSYFFYIILFIIFYMLDEFIVFLIAFLTMTIWLASSKAITWISLAESIILFILGIYYLFGFSFLL